MIRVDLNHLRQSRRVDQNPSPPIRPMMKKRPSTNLYTNKQNVGRTESHCETPILDWGFSL